jgi:o-succinylbenzoate synthase
MTRIRIDGVTLTPFRVDIPRVESARAAWTERRGVLVRASGGGAVGVGEASPLPGYSPDDVDGCERALAAAAPALAGAELAAGPGLLAAIAGRVAAVPAAAPAARFALETALLDLAGQVLGQPVSRLLADAPAGRVPVCALAASPAEAVAAVGAGATAVKVKIGRAGAFARERALLARIRDAIGPEARLRVDVNGGWTASEATAHLEALAPLDLELAEEPVSGEFLASLGTAPVPLAVDESLARTSDADALLALPGVRAAVLKPMILGGALACRTLAARARSRGAAPVVSHLFDGPVAHAACAALALALAPGPAAGLAPHPALSAWPGARAPQVSMAGITTAAAPGLGLAGREALP